MFNALLKVCESSSPERTQRKRFTTEAFCSVLKSDPTLLENFLQEFAGIENETSFKIDTEISYSHDTSRRRIDVIIENRSYLVFLEIKVDSSEGGSGENGQLAAYANILKNQSKKTILLFCTKYQEIKDPELYKPIPFRQFLWRDIYEFLIRNLNLTQNNLVSEFLKYLEKKNMSKSAQLTLRQLDDMKSFAPVFSYFDECLKLIQPSFKTKFSKNKRLNKNLDQKRYGLRQSILDSIENDMHMYFSWSNVSRVEVIFWIGKANQHWEKVRGLVASDEYIKRDLPAREDLFIAPEEWDWFCIGYKTELDKFLNENNQPKAIADWCEEKMVKLYAFMEITKKEHKIPWKI